MRNEGKNAQRMRTAIEDERRNRGANGLLLLVIRVALNQTVASAIASASTLVWLDALAFMLSY